MKSWRMRWAGYVLQIGNANKISLGISERKRPRGRMEYVTYLYLQTYNGIYGRKESPSTTTKYTVYSYVRNTHI
jgi:hypothetical protein